MHTDVTLVSEDFSQVHNGLCNVRSVLSSLENILAPSLLSKLQTGIAQIEQGLASAYAADHQSLDERMDYFCTVAENAGFSSVWSIFEVENIAHHHPWHTARRLAYKDHWGDTEVVVDINGTTWLDLWTAADKAIQLSGDEHHVFIEQFRPKQDDPTTLFLLTGS